LPRCNMTLDENLQISCMKRDLGQNVAVVTCFSACATFANFVAKLLQHAT